MSATVTYKGDTLTTVENQTKVLYTSGTWLEDDITITDETGGQKGYVWQDENGYVHLSDEPGNRVIVDPLTVTQNGTYTASTGHAYNPVTVNVSSGGTSASKKQINFIDYDGTILHSYTKTEWQSVSSLPSNPSHAGLVSQGWNWSKAQIDAQLTAMPNDDVCVGQMYITTSGDTEIDVVFVDAARLSPIMTIAVNGTVTVDWGDNTATDTVTGASLTSRKAVPHTYASTGNYTIKIHVASGTFQFYGSSLYTLLRKSTTPNENKVYANTIQAVRLGNGTTSIGEYAFYVCDSLASITIPSGITAIGSNAFSACYSLASVTIPNGVTSILNNGFSGCAALEHIAIPSGVTNIEYNAFSSCYSLSTITIPSGVTTIGNYAFSACYSLLSVTIPSGVTNIEYNAFSSCYCLTSVTIQEGVINLGDNIFSACYSLASVTLPNGLKSIGNYAFNDCKTLALIAIPSGITSIGNYVFQGCYSLASITIPSEIKSIGNYAFNNCYGIAEYHILPDTPPTLGDMAFSNGASDRIIYVPSSSLEAYQTATNWSTYASYMRGE